MMRLLRSWLGCRRGSVAFATVIALVPAIGAMALGAEAASWYVVKRSAQNAADAAAYSGALQQACLTAGGTCAIAQTVLYRGREFAAQNAFCDASDATSYPGSRCSTKLPSGVSQAVTITVGNYSAGTFTASASGTAVQAQVSQKQPTSLANVLGFSNVTIGATAVAQINTLANPCVLALTQSLSFQGSPTVNAPKCGLASNSTASGAISFTGNTGINVSNVKSISAEGGCAQTGGSQCTNVITYAPPVPNPLSGLDSAMSGLSIKTNCGNTLTAYNSSTSPCVNNNYTFSTKNSPYALSGVYFFSGAVKISGNITISGTASFILLSGASLTISGNPTINLTAPASVTSSQVPAALSSVTGLLSDVLIYDPETAKSGVNITGNSTSSFSGVVYVPNSAVTYQGSTVSNSCTEVIAAAVTLSGNSTFDNSGCPSSLRPSSQYVSLVQ